MDPLDVKPTEELAPESDAAAVIEGTAAPEEAPVASTEPAAMPAEDAAPKYSETFRNRIKTAYPDEEMADDEAFFQKASEQLDNLEQYQNKNMEANKALLEIFDAEPAILEVLKDMIQGASFRAALARHFAPEDLVPVEGAPDEEEYKKNLEARSKRLKDNEDYNKRKTENAQITQQSVDEFMKETGLPEDQATEILTKIGETLDEVYDGKVTKSFLMSMYRALNYDNDVKIAEETGKIAGRNEKIDVGKQDVKAKGDGLPVVQQSGAPQPKPAGKSTWVDSMLQNEKKRNIL